MARTRPGQSLIDDAYLRSDTQGATDRHPRTEVLRHVNQGGAELWDLLIEARGPEYFQATTDDITTLASTTSYALNTDFYLLINARLSGDYASPLVPFTAQEEAFLRDANASTASYPTHYQLRRTVAGANSVVLLPEHGAGYTVKVDYVPQFTDLTDASNSLFDGINGWEAYVVDFAAREMAIKDEEWQLVGALEKNMAGLRSRILKLAPKRDMHRSRRVTDVRGPQSLGRWPR